MSRLLYVTGNAVKFRQAQLTCSAMDIDLQQTELDITEIQAESGEPVARDKAQKAFDILGKPIVVSDDSWMIPGLNNFPGPYMKSMNHWFSPHDWLRLTQALTNRSIILRQIVVYQDSTGQQIFSVDIPGMLLTEIRGTSMYPHSTIVSFDEGKTSDAEHHEQGKSALQNLHTPWHEFAKWHTKVHT